MKGLYYQLKKTSDLTENDYKEIIKLHETFLNLKDKNIIESLKKQQRIYLFREKTNHQLVGTVSTKWITNEKNIIIYLGCAVVDKLYRNRNVVAFCILHGIYKTILKHPLKKIYFCLLASSTDSFSYIQHASETWPQDGEKLPMEISLMMQLIAKQMCGNNFRATDNSIIAYDLATKIQKPLHKDFLRGINVNKTSDFFNKINPEAIKGEQVVCISRINLREYFRLYMLIYHFKLSKYSTTKKIIKKVRSKYPFIAAILMVGVKIVDSIKYTTMIFITTVAITFSLILGAILVIL